MAQISVKIMRLTGSLLGENQHEFVWKVSKGFNREILEAIAHIERFGLRYEPGPDGITVSDMAGQVIMNDRNTSRPIFIPGAA